MQLEAVLDKYLPLYIEKIQYMTDNSVFSIIFMIMVIIIALVMIRIFLKKLRILSNPSLNFSYIEKQNLDFYRMGIFLSGVVIAICVFCILININSLIKRRSIVIEATKMIMVDFNDVIEKPAKVLNHRFEFGIRNHP